MTRQVGSHRRYVVSYTDADGRQATVSTTAAQHPGDIPTGTLRAIERDLSAAFGRTGCEEDSDERREVPGRRDP